ncbi:hypothetical protein EV715DRAFT_161296, partial [Schizophyllum commune]
MAKMWNTAMAQCQERMGVDFLGPQAAGFRSEKDVMDYIQLQADSAPDNEDKAGWQKLRRGLIPLARVAKIFCDPIADTISDASIATHEEFEQITDALEEIKVHLQVIEMVAGHRGQLLADTSVNLLVRIIIVLSAMVEIKPLSEALKDLKQISSRHQEAIIAGTLEVVMNIQASDEMNDIRKWLNFDTVNSSHRMSSLLNDRAKGTGLWFFENRAFVDFIEGQTKMLSIQGKAGCGKSTIISRRRDLDSVLSSFLFQLALGDQNSTDILAKARQQSISNGSFTHNEKLDVLVRMLNGRLQGFLVIDALDEALEHEHARVLGALRKIRSCTNISVLVSSRVPLADKDLQHVVVSIDRVGDNTDIRTALDIEFRNGGRLAAIANAETVRNKLMLRAEGKYVFSPSIIHGTYQSTSLSGCLQNLDEDDLDQLWLQCIFDRAGTHYAALEQDTADVLRQIGASSPP